MYFRRVVKRRSACMTDEEIAELQARAREHALDIQKANDVWQAPVVPGVILCWWCRSYHSPGEVDKCMALPEKRATVGASESSMLNALDAGPLKQYCELWAVLTATTYPDGRRRQTGRLSLSCESSLLKVTVTDQETGQYACLTGGSLDELLLALEMGIADGTCPWRPSSYENGKSRKK